MAHPIENIMKTTMEQIREMVDVNTIVGNPIMTGTDTIILPVSKVCLGFVSGGGEYLCKGSVAKSSAEAMQADERYPFAGTAVAGMNLTPMAFLTINNGEVKMLPAKYDGMWDHVIDALPRCAVELKNVISELCKQKASASNTADKNTSAVPDNTDAAQA